MKTFLPSARTIPFLGLVLSTGLSAAPSPQKAFPDAGLIAAPHSLSNTLSEGIVVGDFEELYPGIYPGYGWASEIREIGSNGLFEVSHVVFAQERTGSGQAIGETFLTALLFRPASLPGSASKGITGLWSPPTVQARRTNRRGVPASPSQVALLTIEEVLRSARSYVASLPYYFFSSDGMSLSFTAKLPASFPGVNANAPALQRISIHLASGALGRTDLILEHAPFLVDPGPGRVEPVRITLATDVSVFRIRYPNLATGALLEAWPYTNQVPRAVELTLGLGRRQRPSPAPRDLSSRIVALPAVGVTSDVQGGLRPGTNSLPQEAWADDAHDAGAELAAATLATQGRAGIIQAMSGFAITEHRSHGDLADDVKFEWLGRSGVEVARYLLSMEAIGPFGGIDSLKQRWAGGPGEPGSLVAAIPLKDLPLGGGTISLTIEDLDRRVNLNVADEIILRQALTLIGLEGNQMLAIVDSILDWQDPDAIPRANGAESEYYLNLTPPYFAKNGRFDDLSELLWIKGMTPSIYYGAPENGGGATGITGLVSLFTPLSSGRININTASAAVLQVIPFIDENIAQSIIQRRAGPDGQDGTEDDMPFRSPAEISMMFGGPPGGPGNVGVFGQFSQMFTVRSLVFEVTVDVQIDGEGRQYVAWVRRDNPKTIQILKMHQR